MDEAEYHRLRLKISRRFVAISKDRRPESVEDAVQWILSEWWRKGDGIDFKRGQTVDQAVVDYLRLHGAGRRDQSSPGVYEAKLALKNALPIEKVDFTLAVTKKESRRGFEDLLRQRKALDRAMLVLYYEWGMSEVEIGNIFGVTESRVSQRLQRIRQRVRETEAAAPGSAGQGSREVEKVLREKEERDLWGVEQQEDKSLEGKESREAEILDEESW